jgi:pyruvate ferredoxin oxidoreductase beta subunit
MMVVNLKTLPTEELLAPGHRLCAGCGPAIAARMTLKAARGPTVVVSSTGCVEVGTSIFPYTSWRIPWVHSLFENAAATASGIEVAFKALERKGRVKKNVDVISLCGDGGTFDIGFQALSGALERGHDFVYICYDNEAYMNTGIQRSGATPHGAATTTSPAGTVIPGKKEFKNDYIAKVRKALDVDGPAVVHVLATCPLGWRSDPANTIKIAKLAVQTNIFPLYEVVKGQYKLNIDVKKPIAVEEYLKLQGRFRHLFKPEFQGEIDIIKRWVEENISRIRRLCSLPT